MEFRDIFDMSRDFHRIYDMPTRIFAPAYIAGAFSLLNPVTIATWFSYCLAVKTPGEISR